MNRPTVFSTHRSILGEGPLWNSYRGSLFWVDINERKIFEKKLNSAADDFDCCWSTEQIVSALALDAEDPDKLWMITDQTFGWLSLASGKYKAVINFELGQGFRSNDGGVDPDGNFWFGSMEKIPTSQNGRLYSISPIGELCVEAEGVGIPNTFCWRESDGEFFLSDSLVCQMFSFSSASNMGDVANAKLFIDLRSEKATPDGGCFDSDGNLWNAQWDGSRVACYNKSGVLIDEVKLPVPRPTSCCFGGPDNKTLFITTAAEGLCNEELSEYRDSGKVFAVELNTGGMTTPMYNFKGEVC